MKNFTFLANTNAFRGVAATAMAGLITVGTAAATTIVAENFGGSGGDLNTTTADTFDNAITTAGGSGTWVAASPFKDNGSLVDGDNQSGYLGLGTYINDSKGTANGYFTLSATVSEIGGGSWGGFGFFESTTPNTAEQFTQANALGSGIFIYRSSGELDGFAGPGSGNGVDGPDAQSGDQLLTIVLDLTPTGGYDGSSNFGTITFFQGDAETGSPLGSHTYTADRPIGAVGLTSAGPSTDGVFSNLQLTQIPEPSVAFLGGLGALLLVRRRR